MTLNFRYAIFLLNIFLFSITGSIVRATQTDDSYLKLQITALRSLPFALSFESFDYAYEPIIGIASQIALDNDERLDIPLIELAEYYFGENTPDHLEAASNRGYRMIKKIERRLKKGGPSCLQHSRQTRKFLNKGGAEHSYRCSDALTVKSFRERLIASIHHFKGEPSPHSWPHSMKLDTYSIEHREASRATLNRAMVATLPNMQAAYIRSKGKEGWPTWFRIGVFTEVLAREPHPSMDLPLLELRDFSLGPEADASMQRALLYRMQNFPRFAALVQARLIQAPSWLGFPLLSKDVKRIDPSNPNSPIRDIAVEALNPYGVKALTQAERNVELQKLLVMFKAR